jgi:molybdopterin-binding protein
MTLWIPQPRKLRGSAAWSGSGLPYDFISFHAVSHRLFDNACTPAQTGIEYPRLQNAWKGDSNMKLSARNQLKGTVVEIQDGAVNGTVKIDIGGGNVISSVITMSSIRELGLKVGGTAYAVIKASNVMVGVDD